MNEEVLQKQNETLLQQGSSHGQLNEISANSCLSPRLNDDINIHKETHHRISRNTPVMAAEEVKKPFTLPWPFRIVAWILLVCTCCACGFFIWSYGITFGDETCKKWITSILVSFVSSAFLSQPIKVLFQQN